MDNKIDYSATNKPQHTDAKTFEASVYVYPGLAYALNNRWQIEMDFPNLLEIKYDHLSQKSQDTPSIHSTENQYSLSSSLSNTLQLNIGLRYLIGNK